MEKSVDADVNTKECTKCGELLPATTKYFYKHPFGMYGLRSVCKECIRVQQAKYDEQRRVIKKKKLKNLDVGFRNGSWYRLRKQEPRNVIKIFVGKLIQETNYFITLKNSNGIAESFLKADIHTGECRVKRCER